MLFLNAMSKYNSVSFDDRPREGTVGWFPNV